jgi:hypothetical protein
MLTRRAEVQTFRYRCDTDGTCYRDNHVFWLRDRRDRVREPERSVPEGSATPPRRMSVLRRARALLHLSTGRPHSPIS